MNYQTHTDGIKGMRSRIEKSMENGVLYRNLNHDLINELNETGLLKLLIRKRVELLIENQIQNEGKTKQEFFHECFGPRVENFYLDKKEKNETIDFKILRNNKKNGTKKNVVKSLPQRSVH